jgi:hypothetical protein
MYLSEQLQKKWAPILEHPDLGNIKDPYKRAVTTILLENQEKSQSSEAEVLSSQNFLTEAGLGAGGMPDIPAAQADPYGTASQGHIAKFDPIMISLVRRAMPNLIAYDICGVQPMTGPTGLIFAMRAKKGSGSLDGTAGNEAFYHEADTKYSANSASTQLQAAGSFNPGLLTTDNGAANTKVLVTAGAMPTGQAEHLTPELMSFSIEKVSVTARSRALRADYTMEVAQDLKAVHGLDAETELSNILSAEILAEINREVVRKVYQDAKPGAQNNTTNAGIFDLDTDSNGRWSVEKFKGLMFQIEREANAIAKDTRRGKGNIIITSSDVASALQMAGVLDYAPALDSNNLSPDDTGNTFVGVLNGRYRVYIDPYAVAHDNNWFVCGYKGSSAYDAGIFYCPYVPLQMVRAVDTNTFQPKIGFKTRYGMVRNPFAKGITIPDSAAYSDIGGDMAVASQSNVYYRLVRVDNLM